VLPGFLGPGLGFSTPSLDSSLDGIGFMKDSGTHETMMRWQMMLGVKVGKIGAAWGPEHKELSLLGLITDPVEPHIHVQYATFQEKKA
jgi:hypothetical protein